MLGRSVKAPFARSIVNYTSDTARSCATHENRYSISDLDSAKVIFGLGTSFSKSSWYSTSANPGQTTLFSEQSLTRRTRTQAVPSDRLSELSALNQAVDMRHWFQCCAFDVIGMTTYGKRLGFLDRGEDVGNVISALDDLLGYASVVGIFPGLHRILFSLKNLMAGVKGAGRAYVVAFTQERIREVQANPKTMPLEDDEVKTQHFSKFQAKHSTSPSTFTSFHVLAGCVSNMVAGSDTTAISLSAVMYYLLKNPACMAKLREEVDLFTAQGQLSNHPTYKETQQLPYLQVVIKEALRLHPATGLPLERVVPKGGATITGHFFPEGTIVGINTWVAHHDCHTFGPNADEFMPERWLQNDTDQVALMNRFWMPFGLGSRTCIGRHISMLEMCKLIPSLVRDFDFTLHESLLRKDWHTQNYWFVKPLDFQVRLRRREFAS
ncbi:hypothetical protein NCS52_00126300 [Fusarium sp. LHS14.1]|nr:hypothetical protein NCS52_00126300 [Fusarium sp. LHS14.1]